MSRSSSSLCALASLREDVDAPACESVRARDCSSRISRRFARDEADILDRRADSLACRSSMVGFPVDAHVDGSAWGTASDAVSSAFVDAGVVCGIGCSASSTSCLAVLAFALVSVMPPASD